MGLDGSIRDGHIVEQAVCPRYRCFLHMQNMRRNPQPRQIPREGMVFDPCSVSSSQDLQISLSDAILKIRWVGKQKQHFCLYRKEMYV